MRKFQTQATCHRSGAGKGARWVSSPRSQVGGLTLKPRSGCPNPGAERVSSLRSREGVLTLGPIGCPHPSPRAASGPTWSKSYQDNLVARAEVAVVLHHPLRDLDMTFPGRRTNTPCLSVSRRSPPSASRCRCTTGHRRTC